MKIKRILSGTMAGVMAVSTSLVMELPAAAESISVTIYESRRTGSWESFDVNLSEYGIMDSGTSVKITAKVAELDIKQTDDETGEESTPQWAFGVIINNNWDHATMPHCNYDSTQTEFSITLTAEELSMNPQFTIQQQLPCDCEITVEAIDLQKDSRTELSLPAIDTAVTLYTFRGSSWLVGAACGGNYVFQQSALSGVTYGETTVGEFRNSFKSIKTTGNSYYSDSLGVGAENFTYNIGIEMTGDDGQTQYVDSSFNSIDFTSDGQTYIDNMFPDDSLDDLKITRIELYICSKYEWSGEYNKSVTVNEKIRDLLVDTRVVIEPEQDTRRDVTLDPATAKSVTVEMSVNDQGDKWLQGVVSLPVGEFSGLTLADFLDTYHCISIDSPGYAGNTAGVEEDDLLYNLQFAFQNNDRSDGRWLDNSYTLFTDKCSLYTTIYEDRRDGAEDYKLTEIGIRVTPKMEELEDGTKQIANETLRNMNDGDSFIVEFVKDDRPDVPVTVSDSAVSLGVWDDVDGGWLDGVGASGKSELLTIPGIDYNVTDLKNFVAANKSISATLPYFSDSVGAGREAFDYQFLFVFGDGSELYCDSSATLGDGLTQLTDDIDLSGCSNTIVKEAYLNVNAKREFLESGKMQTVSEKIRDLKPGDSIFIEFTEDERKAVQLETPTSPVLVNLWKAENDDQMVGSDFSGWTSSFEIPGVTYGETTFEELKENVKSLTATLPYYSDTVGAGKEAFRYAFVFGFSDDNWVFCMNSANAGETLTQYLDQIDLSGVSNTVIERVFLNIIPVTEQISDDHVQAASEVIRSLDKCSFVYEPVKDARKDLAAEISVDETIELQAHEEPDWFDGIIAWLQLESDEINGITAEELFSSYRSISVSAPGFCADSLGLGIDGYGYQLGIRFVNENSDDYYFVENMSRFDEGCTLYTTLIENDFAGYKVDGILMKFWALTEEVEGGKPRSVSPEVRELDPGDIITIVCRSDAPVVTTKPGNGQVELSWTKPEHAEEYRVYTYADGKFTLVKTTADNSCTVTGLTNGTKYGFAVAARIFSTWSEPDSADVVYATPTNGGSIKPTNVSATAGNAQVTVTWDKNENVDKYAVYTYINGKFTVVGMTTATTYTVTGLTNGTKYGFMVRGVSGSTWSQNTTADVVYATPTNGGSIKPTNVRATAGNAQVTVTWDKNENVDKYAVYTYINGKFTMVGMTTATTYTVTGLTNGTKYGFMVRGVSGSTWSQNTTADVVYATPTNGGSIKPANVRVSAGNAQVTVTWDKNENVDKYAVYTYINSKFTMVGMTTETTYTVTGLTNGTKYGFMVRGVSGSTWSQNTTADVVYATPTNGGSIKPANVRATAGNAQVTVTWDKNENVDKYAVYTYIDGKFTLIGMTTATTYTVTGLTNGTKYGFMVRGVSGSTWSQNTTADVVYATPTSGGSIKPTNVRASAGNAQVTVTWDKNENVDKYAVYTYINGKFTMVGMTTATTYTVTGLTNGTKYGFMVRGISGSTWSQNTTADVVYATPTES